MIMPFIPYSSQSIDEEDRHAVALALTQKIITRGNLVAQFEEELARYCQSKRAVLFNSGTSGLYAAFHVAQVSSIDRFITTCNSFIATSGSGMRLGAIPCFVDIERSSGNINLNNLQKLLEKPPSRGRFVVCPVHFSGIALDMSYLDSLIRTPESVVIEDAAHALGSTYPGGRPVGCCDWSQMTVFSFHPSKNITMGEGGAVTTNDEELYQRLRQFRDNGIAREKPFLKQEVALGYYEVQQITGNFHVTEMQAALGLSQLKKLPHFINKRRRLVAHYRDQLKGRKGIHLFDESFDARTAYHIMVLQIDFEHFGKTRGQVMEALREQGIGSQVHYIPLYRHPVLEKKFHSRFDEFPEMETYYSQALTLPLFYDLSEEDVQRICTTLLHCLGINGR